MQIFAGKSSSYYGSDSPSSPNYPNAPGMLEVEMFVPYYLKVTYY